MELLQNIILIIGGSDHPVNYSRCIEKLYNFQKFTLGRCVIDFSKDYIKIYREDKGFKILHKTEKGIFDNRMYVNFVNENSFFVSNIGKHNLIDMYNKKILRNLKNINQKSSLPAVFSSESKVLSVYGIDYRKDDIEWADIKFCRKFIPFISIYH